MLIMMGRCLMITKDVVYRKYVNMKMLICHSGIITCNEYIVKFIDCIDTWLDKIFLWAQFTHYIANGRTGLFLITYCYLLSVILNLKRIKEIRPKHNTCKLTTYASQAYNITLSRTIMYICMCLVFFTLRQIIMGNCDINS